MKLSTAALLAAALSACGGSTVQRAPAGPHALSTLRHVSVLASTADPANHDTYPFGLAISPAVAYPNGTPTGLHLQAGDLLVSNFGNAAGVQGKGTTVELIRPGDPTPAAQTFFSGASAVAGISISGVGMPWFAEFGTDGNPPSPMQVTSPTGTLAGGGNFAQGSVPGAWGVTFNGQKPPLAAFFATDAVHGTLLRIAVVPGNFNTGTITEIAKGFPVNGNPPPAGETFAASVNGPQQMLSSVTRNLDGNLVVSNNGASGNLLVEITPDGKLVETVDPIALGGRTVQGGQIVTAVATAGTSGQQLIYFTDDSDGTVKVLAP